MSKLPEGQTPEEVAGLLKDIIEMTCPQGEENSEAFNSN